MPVDPTDDCGKAEPSRYPLTAAWPKCECYSDSENQVAPLQSGPWFVHKIDVGLACSGKNGRPTSKVVASADIYYRIIIDICFKSRWEGVRSRKSEGVNFMIQHFLRCRYITRTVL
jgi:hypothetical protein